MRLTLLNLSSITPPEPPREATAQEILKILRENPQARIVGVMEDDGWPVIRDAQGDTYVSLTPFSRDVEVSRSVCEQLKAGGLIEEESRSTVAILYKLRESAKCQHRWRLMSDGVGVEIGRVCAECGKEEYWSF